MVIDIDGKLAVIEFNTGQSEIWLCPQHPAPSCAVPPQKPGEKRRTPATPKPQRKPCTVNSARRARTGEDGGDSFLAAEAAGLA
jgi:hypothetical protein